VNDQYLAGVLQSETFAPLVSQYLNIESNKALTLKFDFMALCGTM
jgi:hypothetical protein